MATALLERTEQVSTNLSSQEKYQRLTKIQDKTLAETILCLKRYGRALVVRPTGFGKTYMLVNLAKKYITDEPQKQVLYIYPLKVIKEEIQRPGNGYMQDGLIERGMVFRTFNYFTNAVKKPGAMEKICNDIKRKYSLVIIDEAHRSGADGWQMVYEDIAKYIGKSKTHLVGATATPDRPDEDKIGGAIEDLVFEGHRVSEYTLLDAMNDGIMPWITYRMARHDIENPDESQSILIDSMEQHKDLCKREGKLYDDQMAMAKMHAAMRECVGAGEFILQGIQEAKRIGEVLSGEPFKFIVFFPTIARMAEMGPKVESWFRNAFNKCVKDQYSEDAGRYNIMSYYVASADTQGREVEAVVREEPSKRAFFKESSDLGKIVSLPYRVNLVFTVNMINMGYHVEDTSGVMMLRGTKSDIIYMQQLGRCLSVKSDKSPIIYDLVGNVAGTRASDDEIQEAKRVIMAVVGGSGYSGGRTPSASDMQNFDRCVRIGGMDATGMFLNALSSGDFSRNEKIVWMYKERRAPICMIASELKISCYRVALVIKQLGYRLRKEDAMYLLAKQKSTKMVTLINSKQAAMDCKRTGAECLFNLLNSK